MKSYKFFLALALSVILVCSGVVMNAATQSITVIEDEDTNLGYIQNLKCGVAANMVTVEGVTPASGDIVTFWIHQDAATPVDLFYYEYDTPANSNGVFALRFILNTNFYDTANGATATLRVGGLGLNTYKTTINLYSQTQIDDCITDFKNVGVSVTFADFFTEHSAMLGISSTYTADELAIITKYHIANPVPSDATSDKVVEMIGALATKLSKHEALVADISAKAQGTDAEALGAVITNADNAALLAEYGITFDLTDLSFPINLWTKLLNPEGYATIEAVKTAFDTQKAIQIADEVECADYFKKIDHSSKTLNEFFTVYADILGIEAIDDAEKLAILKTYYDRLTITGSETVSEVSDMIGDIISKLTRHQALVGFVDDYAKGTDAGEIKRVLTDAINYGDIVDFVTTQGILNENDMWQRMLNPEGYASLDEIKSAFEEAYEAQLKEDKAHGGVIDKGRSRNFLDKWTITNVANRIRIKGYLGGGTVEDILLHVSGMEGGISNFDSTKTLMIAQFKTKKYCDENGYLVDDETVFDYTFTINTDRIGNETIGVLRLSAEDTNIQLFHINLFSTSEMESMANAFKSISDKTGLVSFLNQYAEMLSVADYTERQLDIMYQLYEESSSAGVYAPMTADEVAIAFSTLKNETFYNEKNMDEEAEFLSALNKAASVDNEWEKIKGLFTDSYEYIELDFADITGICNEQAFYKRLFNIDCTSLDAVRDNFVQVKAEHLAYESNVVESFVSIAESADTKAFVVDYAVELNQSQASAYSDREFAILTELIQTNSQAVNYTDVAEKFAHNIDNLDDAIELLDDLTVAANKIVGGITGVVEDIRTLVETAILTGWISPTQTTQGMTTAQLQATYFAMAKKDYLYLKDIEKAYDLAVSSVLTGPEIDSTAATVCLMGNKTQAGKTIEIPVALSNNPGFVSMRLQIEYDSAIMTLINVADSGLLSGALHSSDYTANPYVLYWDNGAVTENITANGNIAILTFSIKDNVTIGRYPITISYDATNSDIIDVNRQPVQFATYSGYVEVVNYISGDINGDGEVTTKDVTTLRRYIVGGYDVTVVDETLDVNSDDAITTKDVTTLRRFIAGGYGVELN